MTTREGRATSSVQLPERLTPSTGYQRPPRELSTYVPDYTAELMAKEAKAS